MQTGLFDVVMKAAILSSIIPMFALIIRKGRVTNFIFVTLFIYCGLSLITDVTCYVFAINGIGIDLIIQIYTVAIFILILELYKFEINTKALRKVLSWLALSFIGVALYFPLFENGIYQINPEPHVILSIIVVFLSSYYLYDIFIKLEIPRITDHYFFWINSAFLIYFGSTFFIVSFEQVLVQSDSKLDLMLWPIQHVSAIIFNLIIAKGIWTMKRV